MYELGQHFLHGFYTRWLLISLCAHMEIIRHFELLKAFGYIERDIKFDFFRKKTLFTSYVRNVKRATILYKDHVRHRVFLRHKLVMSLFKSVYTCAMKRNMEWHNNFPRPLEQVKIDKVHSISCKKAQGY